MIVDIEKLKEAIDSKITSEIIVDEPNPREVYSVVTTCDAGDGDIVEGHCTFYKEEFENNLLLKLVLSMVSIREGELFPDEECGNGIFTYCDHTNYGSHVSDNEYFPWLKDYLVERNLLPFCYFIDDHAHSIDDVDIIYYDSKGERYRVTLPDFDELFETKEDTIDTLNLLYEQWLDTLEVG